MLQLSAFYSVEEIHRLLNLATLLPAGEEVFLNATPLNSQSMGVSCNEANRNFYMVFSFR
jgi:hypothetical protein